MVYIDTSVLAAYYCPETFSAKAEQGILTAPHPAISWLVEVEMSSALQGKVLRGEIEEADRTKILAQFKKHIEEGCYEILPVNRMHCELAREWISLFSVPLRTLDALHLAICYASDGTLMTADQGLIKAARHLDVPLIPW